jgi:hypothetical protein
VDREFAIRTLVSVELHFMSRMRAILCIHRRPLFVDTGLGKTAHRLKMPPSRDCREQLDKVTWWWFSTDVMRNQPGRRLECTGPFLASPSSSFETPAAEIQTRMQSNRNARIW